MLNSRTLSSIVRWTGRAAVIIVALLMLVPSLLIIVLSFSDESKLIFPPTAWGVRQYELFLGSAYWRDAIAKSFAIGIPAAIIAIAVGTPVAYAISRSSMPGRSVLRGLGLAPLVIPGVAYAVAMYTFYGQVRLLGQAIGLILAHAVLGIPFVIVVITAALVRIPVELEMVAMTLGASRMRAAIGITGRLLAPALVTSFVFVFITSFDEATFVNFVGGPGLTTLPKAIFDSVRTGLDPVITAIATILMVSTGLIMAAALRLRRD